MLTARDVMTTPVETVAPDGDVSERAIRSAAAERGGFPLVDGDKLVGAVTRQDVLAALRGVAL